MAVLPVLTYPDPRLRQPSEPVEAFGGELRELLGHLWETLRAGPPGSVGLAAPQLGHHRRVVLVDCGAARRPVPHHGPLVLINPEILAWEGLAVGREGCLSVPDLTGKVVRAERVEVEALDERGRRRRYRFQGFEARVVQHEVDHLDGLLFLDRLVSRRADLRRRG